MILKSSKSRISQLNLFADYILNQIPKTEKSLIKIVDCVNFIIIKGKTSHKELLDFTKIKIDFCEKFQINSDGGSNFHHTIDLMEYDEPLESVTSLTHNFFNSQNCSYNNKQIESFKQNPDVSYEYCSVVSEINDNDLVLCSEFPHGHSLDMGRLLYYYGKKITYSIPSTYPFSSLLMTITDRDHEEKFKVYDVDTKSEDESLRSAILDVFDFNFSDLNKKLKDVEFYDEILNPLSDYSFLKERNEDLIIV